MEICENCGAKYDEESEIICPICKSTPKLGVSQQDLGLCPHGHTDDEGCEVDGCSGGPDGWDNLEENY